MKKWIQILASGLVAVGATQVALAHGAGMPAGDTHWGELWNADVLTILCLVAMAALYAIGLGRLCAQRANAAPVRPRHVLAFAAGVAFLVVALVSPVDVLADELQWMHMVQHMVLMNLAAPLIVMGAPIRVMLWAIPRSHRRISGLGRRAMERRGLPRYLLWQPLVLLVLYGAVLWVWHLPVLYEAALHSRVVHDLQHIMFFAVSCLFWRVLFDPIGRLRMARGAAVLYLFATSLHATVLGVFMALAPRLWYPTYAGRTETWGLGALEDQQFAGYIMWMPACMIYALVAAVLFAAWLREEDEGRTPAADR